MSTLIADSSFSFCTESELVTYEKQAIPRFPTEGDGDNLGVHEVNIFHPSHLKPYRSSDLIERRPAKIFKLNHRSRSGTPELVTDPEFTDVYGIAHEKEDISLQIIPNIENRSSLATNKEIRKVANTLGGMEAFSDTYIHAPYEVDLNRAEIVGMNKKPDLYSMVDRLNDPTFNEFANVAYASKEGYAIRTNPTTGETEMFIAGTRNGYDWISNMLEVRPPKTKYFERNVFAHLADGEEAYIGHHATPWRKEAQEHYALIAMENNVDIVYGHSRGGAIVADMELPDNVEKIGLDAAMVIADNKDMLNYYEAGPGQGGKGLEWIKSRFDAGIGLSGKKNRHMNLSKKFHHSWGD